VFQQSCEPKSWGTRFSTLNWSAAIWSNGGNTRALTTMPTTNSQSITQLFLHGQFCWLHPKRLLTIKLEALARQKIVPKFKVSEILLTKSINWRTSDTQSRALGQMASKLIFPTFSGAAEFSERVNLKPFCCTLK
jgi:hypothetical protein